MALNQATLKAQILVLLNESFAKTDDPAAALDDFAEELSAQITAHIKTATITLPIGSVVVTGTAATQTNPAPIVGAVIT